MFAESKHLPTAMSLVHKMILEAKSVNIRPYKISFMQKKKIEKLEKKMLHNEII